MSIDFGFGREPQQSRSHGLSPAFFPARSTAFGAPSAGARVGLILAALATVVLTCPGCGGLKPQAAASGPPMSVGVVKTIQMDVPVHAEWVATLDGYVNALDSAPGERVPHQPELQGRLVRPQG